MAEENKSEKCKCPYCDVELMQLELPCCQACGVTILHCPECGKPVPQESKLCPDCGAEIIV